MKKKIIIVFLTFVVVLAVFCTWKLAVSVSANDTVEIEEYIAKKNDIELVSMIRRKEAQNYLAILYYEEEEIKMMIFEKNILGRYEYFGGGFSSSDISTYNFNQSGTWSLIVVYGDNHQVGAYSYEFTNAGRTYGNDKLGEYILDIYCIENTAFAASDGYLFDEEGNEIGRL